MAGVTPYTHDDWKKTNADRIRSMTDEELAEYLSGIAECHRGCKLNCGDSCIGAWLDWLRQEEGQEPT